MKKRIVFLLPFFLLSCSKEWDDIPSPNLKEDDFTFFVASDLHYLDPSLRDETFAPNVASISGDGKATYYSEEILDTYIDTIKEKKPDGVFFTGDNTLNGSQVSHDGFISKIKEIQKEGIPVYVLLGNHDVGNYPAFSFLNGKSTSIPVYKAEEVKQKYSRFGYHQAEYKDPNSFTYVKEVAKNTYAIMLDSNTDSERLFTNESLNWLEGVLETLHSKNATVLSFSHQPLLLENKSMGESNIIVNAERIRSLYQKYNVCTNFAGHLHTQHIAKEDGLLEILTSSLSITPNHYGVIHSQKGKWSYHTENLDVSSFAKKQGYTDPNLLNFSSFIDWLFDKTNSYNLTRSFYQDEELTNEKRNSLINIISLLNKNYFTGIPLEKNEENDKKVNELETYLLKHQNKYLNELIEEYLANKNYNSISF